MTHDCLTPTLLAARLPILVTGIAGVAGFSLFHHLQGRFPGQVVGIRPRQTWRLKGEGVIGLDAEDRDELQALFRQHRFGAVLHSTGSCALKSCELDPAMARLVNVESAVIMAESVRAHGSRLVFLSTDLVFSGTLGRSYQETDPVDPVTVYGKTMAEAERLVLATVPEAALLRISLPMGPSFNRHAGAIDWIDSRFRNGRPATLYFDEVRSSTYVEDLNRVFEWFLGNDFAGLFHLGGPRPLALYQIGQIVNRVGGYEPSLLKGCPRIEAGPMPPRAGDVTMNSERLYRLMGGCPFQPWPADENLVPRSRHWHRERSPGEDGSFQNIRDLLYRASTVTQA